MADAHSSQGSPAPGENRGSSAPCPPDCDLPENSQDNLDARLDHAIEETFPTSDPISVTITKGPEPDSAQQEARSSSADDQQSGAEQGSTEHLLDQVRGALNDGADQAFGAAQEAYRRGERYIRQAGERYPQAERYFQEGRKALNQRITESPWPYLLAAAAGGYLLGLMIHGGSRRREQRVPDYARTQRGYASHRNDQHG
jgi:ElaB/YqjD/DUF883 family membrane-anchored ribosome-binding protein